MNKYDIVTKLIKEKFNVRDMLYLIDGIDKNPIYLVWDNSNDKYLIITYYNEELQTVSQINSMGKFVDVWSMLVSVLSVYEKHN